MKFIQFILEIKRINLQINLFKRDRYISEWIMLSIVDDCLLNLSNSIRSIEFWSSFRKSVVNISTANFRFEGGSFHASIGRELIKRWSSFRSRLVKRYVQSRYRSILPSKLFSFVNSIKRKKERKKENKLNETGGWMVWWMRDFHRFSTLFCLVKILHRW